MFGLPMFRRELYTFLSSGIAIHSLKSLITLKLPKPQSWAPDGQYEEGTKILKHRSIIHYMPTLVLYIGQPF